MSRIAWSLPVRDVSAFAKALSRQLSGLGRLPGHLELLNMLARSAGFQNFQHLREAGAPQAPAPAAPAESFVRPFPASGGETPGGEAHGNETPRAHHDAQARHDAQAHHDAQPPGETPVDLRRLNRLLRFFDRTGQFVRWPGKYGEQTSCLWVVWSRLAPGPAGDEAAVNARLAALHTFGDHALLRRELFDRGFMDRTPDGRAYRRVERKPDPLALALIGRVKALQTP